MSAITLSGQALQRDTVCGPDQTFTPHVPLEHSSLAIQRVWNREFDLEPMGRPTRPILAFMLVDFLKRLCDRFLFFSKLKDCGSYSYSPYFERDALCRDKNDSASVKEHR